MQRTDLVSAGILFVAGLAVILWVIPTYVTVGMQTDGDLSPAFMPYVAAVLATGAAGALFVARLTPNAADDDEPPLPLESWYFIGATTLIFAVTFVLMSTAGYLYAGATIIAGFMMLARANPKAVVVTAIALPITLWVLFSKLLGFPLP